MKAREVACSSVKMPNGVLHFVVAVDAHGRLWWWESDQATWQLLPPLPDDQPVT